MVLIRGLDFMRLLFTAVLFNIYMIIDYCGGQRVQYGVLTDCIGKNALDYILTTKDNMTHVGCALQCEEMYHCMLFFYNSRTGSCSFHNQILTHLNMTHADSSMCFMRDDIVHSWVVQAMAPSRLNSPATNVIGKPNGQVWIPADDATPKELRVRIASEMYIVQIYIYELGDYGTVDDIELLTPDDTWYSVWSWMDEYQHRADGASQIVSHDIKVTDFKASQLRVRVTGDLQTDDIDAIMVVGYKLRLSRSGHGPKLIEYVPPQTVE